MIFPGVLAGIRQEKGKREPVTTPPGVESIFIHSGKRDSIELWRLPPRVQPARPVSAIIFHGNDGDVRSFFIFQEWFESLGITSYGFDYRGFGRSTGWPSERGIREDAESVWNYVTERDKPEAVVVFGYSIGAAPAAVLAATHQVDTLILLAPFTSIRAVVETHPIYRYLTPFLWYNLGTERAVSELEQTCLIVAHGARDDIIPYQLGQAVFSAYRGRGESMFLPSETAHHLNIFATLQNELTAGLERCLQNE